MTDYKGFYEAMVEHAEDWGRICEAGEVLDLSDREAAMLRFAVEDIVVEAEKHVPGGYHTEIFNVEYK